LSVLFGLMNDRRMRWLAALLAASCSCSQDPWLADGENRQVQLLLSVGPTTDFLMLLGPQGTCPNFNAVVDIDGRQLPLAGAGMQVGLSRDPINICPLGGCLETCMNEHWLLTRPLPEDTPVSTLTLTDMSATWKMSVSHMYAPRTLKRIGPQQFAWSPAEDGITAVGVESADGFGLDVLTSTNAGIITIDSPLDAGSYTLTAVTFPTVLSCDGPAGCTDEPTSPAPLSFTVP
jgi:hypothetical protein